MRPGLQPRQVIAMSNDTTTRAEPNASVVVDLTSNTFDEQVREGLTVVDFWAPWCAPCRAMAPQIERAARLRPQYRFAKVNVDEHPELAARFAVRSIPTLAVIRDGNLMGTAAGLVGADDLVAALDRAA
jgi:thioredoxin